MRSVERRGDTRALGGENPGVPSPLREHWLLDPDVTFLNHGSFGACPVPVLEEQRRWRERMERQPVRFLDRELEGLLDRARARLAAIVGADPDDLAFVPNATTAVNAVLRSLDLRPGDEILVSDHGYNACRNVVEFVTARAGARVRVAHLPFPGIDEDEVVGRVLAAVTPATRLALLDHVTSPTGLVLPIERLTSELATRGIEVLVDGAHAPGMLALDLDALGASYYTGNCHKWLCAPKGAAFLWVRRDRREGVRPAVLSHGANSPRTDRSRFRLEFDWTGTDDPSPYLSVPAAIDFLESLLPGGLAEVRERNRRLALAARDLLLDVLDVPPPAPASMIGSLAAVPLPPAAEDAGPPPSPLYRDPLHDVLHDRYAIEVPVVSWPAPAVRLLRVSAQLYNDLDDYRALARALRELADAGELGGASFRARRRAARIGHGLRPRRPRN